MIEEALTFIKSELSAYLAGKIDATDGRIVLDNIASYDLSNPSADLQNCIVMSLVNVEEESTLKNNSNIRRNPLNNSIDYIDLPVHLNLYILFASTPAGQGSTYEKSLVRLSYLIQFFQHQNRFESTVTYDKVQHNIRLVFELYTLTFEQINHLWGSLGGKQIPFAMYKARLIKLQENVSRSASIIEEINNNVNELNLS